MAMLGGKPAMATGTAHETDCDHAELASAERLARVPISERDEMISAARAT
jgi:hypothetical protein